MSGRTGADDQVQPIGGSELDQLFGSALAAPIALAVSGGADSMALLHLVARALERPQCKSSSQMRANWVRVLTVDHQLRSESAAEAAFVKAQAERLGFVHTTLHWQGEKPASGLQAAARAARYALMASALTNEQADGGPRRSLITAHHAGDQAETLLMRLARGSGVSGLAAMRSVSQMHGVTLLRPLLAIAKSRLVATLQAAGAGWIEDPSNTNQDFERIRIREALKHLAALGIDEGKLSSSALRLARADAALERLTCQLSAAAQVSHHGGAFASLDYAAFCEGETEARIRLLGRLIATHGGQEEAPRLSQLEELDHQFCGRGTIPASGGAVTLGGCSVRWDPAAGWIRVFREMGRNGLSELTLMPGQFATWDRRFLVSFQKDTGENPITVRALGGDAYATLRVNLACPIPALAGATLPAFFQNGALVAVPYFQDQLPQLAGSGSGSKPAISAISLIGSLETPASAAF